MVYFPRQLIYNDKGHFFNSEKEKQDIINKGKDKIKVQPEGEQIIELVPVEVEINFNVPTDGLNRSNCEVLMETDDFSDLMDTTQRYRHIFMVTNSQSAKMLYINWLNNMYEALMDILREADKIYWKLPLKEGEISLVPSGLSISHVFNDTIPIGIKKMKLIEEINNISFPKQIAKANIANEFEQYSNNLIHGTGLDIAHSMKKSNAIPKNINAKNEKQLKKVVKPKKKTITKSGKKSKLKTIIEE